MNSFPSADASALIAPFGPPAATADAASTVSSFPFSQSVPDSSFRETRISTLPRNVSLAGSIHSSTPYRVGAAPEGSRSVGGAGASARVSDAGSARTSAASRIADLFMPRLLSLSSLVCTISV